MTKRIALIMLVVALASVGCRSEQTRFAWSWADVPGLVDAELDDPEADAIVVSRERRFRFQAVGADAETSEIHTHDVIKILSEAAFEHAKVRLFWPKKSRLLHLDARTIAPDGTITPLDSSSVFASEITLDEDTELAARFFQFPRVDVGGFLELSYTISVEGLYTGWSEQISDAMPVRSYQAEIVVDSIAVPDLTVTNHAARPRIVKSDDGFQHIYLEAKNVKPEVDERLAPPSRAAEPWWMYRTVRYDFRRVWYTNQDWSDAARKAYELVTKGKGLEGTPDFNVDACAGNPHCIVAAALKRTRELTTFTGFGSVFEHRPLAEILAEGTADAGDKAVLAYALLKSAGLDVRLAAVARRGSPKPRIDKPALLWLNHTLVVVKHGDEAIWLDPSCEFCAPGTLPSWDPIGDDALVLYADKGKLATSWWGLNGQPAPHTNVLGRELTVAVEATGHANVTIVERYAGEEALFFQARTRNDDDDDARRSALSVVHELSRAGKLVTHLPVECDRERGSCTRIVKAWIPHAAHVSEADGTLRMPLDLARTVLDLRLDTRKADAVVTRPSVELDEIRIVPPAGMKVSHGPATTASGGLFETAISATQDGDALVVKRTRTLKPGRIARAELAKMQTALDTAASLSSHVVHIGP